jgi:hypothetical protein
VFCEKPDWMSDEELKQIRKESSFRLRDDSSYPAWIKSILQERKS